MPLGPDEEGISKRQNKLLKYFIGQIDASLKRGVYSDIGVRTGFKCWLETFTTYDSRDFTEEFWNLLRAKYRSSGWKDLQVDHYIYGHRITLVR